MFERFTEKAVKSIMLAQEEARRLGHNYVGSEQILLGLIGENTGLAAKTLKSQGVHLKEARDQFYEIIGRGSGFVAVEIPFTPRAKRIFEQSWNEARRLGNNYIGTEHVLLGLLREMQTNLTDETEGIAKRVLQSLDVDPMLLESKVLELMKANPPQSIEEGGKGKARTKVQSSGSKPKKDIFTLMTDQATNCITLSREEARRVGHNFVGTEQILLGLIREETGIASHALKSVGVELSTTRFEVVKIIGTGSGFVAVEIPFTPRTKRLFDLSIDEADQLGHNYIGTEHLLLGLLSEGEGVAVRALENLGVDLTALREKVLDLMSDQSDVKAIDAHSEDST